MLRPLHAFLCHLLLLGCWSAAWAQDSSAVLEQHILDTIRTSTRGERHAAAEYLSVLAASAEAEVPMAWARAQAGVVENWVKGQQEQEIFSLQLAPQKLLDEVLARCEAAQLTDPLSYVWEVQGWLAMEQGASPLAARAWERAGAYALDHQQVSRAVDLWLMAARTYSHLQHAAHLQECSAQLTLLGQARAAELSAEDQRKITAFQNHPRTLSVLAVLPAYLRQATAERRLQPTTATVQVSNGEREKGRTRFTLANHQTTAMDGLLTLTAASGAVDEWTRRGAELTIKVRPSLKPGAAQHPLRLLPGETLKIFVEYHFITSAQNVEDHLQLDWTDAHGSQVAEGEFTSRIGASPVSQIINANTALRGPWPTPFYHEIYYRGRGQKLQIENLLTQIQGPAARVEIYNEETGELLAVDAEGDGLYTGEADSLADANDRDDDTRPDLVVGPQNVGCVEVYVFPHLASAAGARLSLQLADYATTPAIWRQDAVDEQQAGTAAGK